MGRGDSGMDAPRLSECAFFVGVECDEVVGEGEICEGEGVLVSWVSILSGENGRVRENRFLGVTISIWSSDWSSGGKRVTLWVPNFRVCGSAEYRTGK